MKADGDSVRAFLCWVVVGALGFGGVLTMLSVGPFLLLLALFLSGFLLWRVDFGWGMAGMLSGAAIPVACVGWFTATLSPMPFDVLAAVLVVAGVVVFVRQRGR